jgi:hypothetical protein
MVDKKKYTPIEEFLIIATNFNTLLVPSLYGS